MSRFYGDLKGATRRGSGASGVRAHVRGWDVGVETRAYVGKTTHGSAEWARDECDRVDVLLTGGSNAGIPSDLLACVEESKGQRLLIIFNPETDDELARFEWSGQSRGGWVRTPERNP